MPLRRARNVFGVRRRRCVGVIDVGSNSLRLVIYDGIHRSPNTLFNEKAMCGLGRGLEGGLDQILGHRPVPAGQHARIPEQVTGIGPEAGR